MKTFELQHREGREMKRDKITKGSLVDVWSRHCEPGQGLSYKRFSGHLIDNYPGETWDVVDVRKNDGEVQSVYAFSIHPWGRS